jgi:hypothetical protein
MSLLLPLRQRLVITVAAMLLASYLTGLAGQLLFNALLPTYLAGVVGGLAALPVCDFLKRIRPSPEGTSGTHATDHSSRRSGLSS